MKRLLVAALAAVALCIWALPARAQLGIGAGVASAGDDLRTATDGLSTTVGDDTITYSDVSNGLGFYGTARLKWSYNAVRLIGDVSYVYFPASSITLREVNSSGQTVSATFDVGAALVPINLGLELTLPIEYVRPYIGGQFSYTISYRTHTYVSGDTALDRTEVHNQWADNNALGLAVGAGIEFAAGNAFAVDLGVRYNLSGIFKDSPRPPSFLSVGATIFFGDLLKTAKERERDAETDPE